MLKEWIKYLCDPVDKSSLKIDKIVKRKGNDIIFGTLRSRSGSTYQIKDGVPILLNQHTQSTESVDSFAYEWENFDFDYGKKGWLQDIVKPVLGGTRYFRNKIVVDCGAGSGRQSLWMAEAGAKFVFSIELSDSVRSVVKKVTKRFKDRVFVIQADIAHIPIKRSGNLIDLVYCVNVIQHTKNPEKATFEISKLLNSKTDFIFNIYLERGRKFFLTILNFARIITKHIPNIFLKYISFFITVICYLLSFLPFIGIWFKESLPINHGFKETWLGIYDILGTHEYQKFYSEEELHSILTNASLHMIKRSKYALLLNKA